MFMRKKELDTGITIGVSEISLIVLVIFDHLPLPQNPAWLE